MAVTEAAGTRWRRRSYRARCRPSPEPLWDPRTPRSPSPPGLPVRSALLDCGDDRAARRRGVWAALAGSRLEAGWAHVQQAVGRLGGRRVVKGTTRDSDRRARLTEPVVAAIREHRRRQDAERVAAEPRWREHGLIFTTEVGTPLHAGNFYVWDWQALQACNGLPAIRFQDLRNSAATLLRARNVHPKIVQPLLGHSQYSVTMDTYPHVMPSFAGDAAEALGEIYRVGRGDCSLLPPQAGPSGKRFPTEWVLSDKLLARSWSFTDVHRRLFRAIRGHRRPPTITR